MKKWILKAIVQKTISYLPDSHKINYLFQKHITKGVELSDQYFHEKLQHAIDHIKYYRQFAKDDSSFKVLELGSGWYPVVPIALFLCGADKITTLDISPLMHEKGIRETMIKFLVERNYSLLKQLEPFIKEERWNELNNAANTSDLPSLQNKLKLEIKIADARNTGFENASYDLICSNNVFEHIYPDVLKDILPEFKRLLKPHGIGSHFIDMSDHFAHLDKEINIYHFLRFSKDQWKIIDNDVQPQNRLRYPDYLDIYKELDIEIIALHKRDGSIEDLKQVDIHSDYNKYTAEDLAVSHVHLVNSGDI